MAASNYAACLAFTLKYEGGYSNHPADPGGATMKGVTQAVYDGYRRRKGLFDQSVRSISDVEVQDIYRTQYWNVIRGDDLPKGVDLAVFDFAVNSGPSRAAKVLQKVLGVAVDGLIGEATLNAANDADPDDLVAKLCDARLAFVRGLSTFSTFGRGWTARIKAVRSVGQDMAGGAPVRIADMPAADSSGAEKAQVKDQSVLSTVTGKGSAAAGVGAAGAALTETAQQIAPLGDFGLVFKIAFAVVLLAGVGFTIYGILKTARSSEALQ